MSASDEDDMWEVSAPTPKTSVKAEPVPAEPVHTKTPTVRGVRKQSAPKRQPAELTVKREPDRNGVAKKKRYTDRSWVHSRHQQRAVNTVIPKACIARIVRNLLTKHTTGTDVCLRIEASAMQALHIAAEDVVISLAADANAFAETACRIAPTQTDIYNAVLMYLRTHNHTPPPNKQSIRERYRLHTRSALLHVAKQTNNAALCIEKEGLLPIGESMAAHVKYLKERTLSREKEKRRHLIKLEEATGKVSTAL